jgi:hypothetical protein
MIHISTQHKLPSPQGEGTMIFCRYFKLYLGEA